MAFVCTTVGNRKWLKILLFLFFSKRRTLLLGERPKCNLLQKSKSWENKSCEGNSKLVIINVGYPIYLNGKTHAISQPKTTFGMCKHLSKGLRLCFTRTSGISIGQYISVGFQPFVPSELVVFCFHSSSYFILR